jgi:hypothetical protein
MNKTGLTIIGGIAANQFSTFLSILFKFFVDFFRLYGKIKSNMIKLLINFIFVINLTI